MISADKTVITTLGAQIGDCGVRPQSRRVIMRQKMIMVVDVVLNRYFMRDDYWYLISLSLGVDLADCK